MLAHGQDNSTFQEIAKNSNFNKNKTFFVFFTILFDQLTRYLFFKNIFRKLIKFFLIFFAFRIKKKCKRKNDCN